MLIYSYGKQLLAPSERIGYIALAPTMPGREEIRMAIITAQLATGYAFPNGVLQHALADLEQLSLKLYAQQMHQQDNHASPRHKQRQTHLPVPPIQLPYQTP